MAKTPQVGEEAPDFELPGTDGPFKLSEHRGERVVLLFYPGDNTMVCTKQFCSYRDRADDFAALDATVVGISSQDLDSHKGFIEKHGLTAANINGAGQIVAAGRRGHEIEGGEQVVEFDRPRFAIGFAQCQAHGDAHKKHLR